MTKELLQIGDEDGMTQPQRTVVYTAVLGKLE